MIFSCIFTFAYFHTMDTLIGVSYEDDNCSASSHQINNCLVDDITLHSFTNDRASEDRADKCSINEKNCRRRLVTLKGITVEFYISNHTYIISLLCSSMCDNCYTRCAPGFLKLFLHRCL